MIERAVFSYFNPDESFSNTAGFKRFDDFLYTVSLAVTLARRHFKEVQIMSSIWGVDLLKSIKIPATEFFTEFELIREIPKQFWAYGKLIAYILQDKPFVHIDNDVFLWKPLPKRILEAELCFQSKEFFHMKAVYGWYDLLKPCWNVAPERPQIIVENEVTDFAYNCGICGGHNLEFFKRWQECSSKYILAPENQLLFFEKYSNLLHHQNLFHEQYFGSSLIKAFNLRDRVEVIDDDALKLVQATDSGYTHLWGVTKTKESTMIRVRSRLKKEDSELFKRVELFCKEKGLDQISHGKEDKRTFIGAIR